MGTSADNLPQSFLATESTEDTENKNKKANSKKVEEKTVNELDKILIKYNRPDFNQKLAELHRKIVMAAGLELDEARDTILKDILLKVRKEGASAVAELTEELDGVKLSPEEFQINEFELRNAHQHIDKDLLSSIRKAISNVREYQSKIFIGNRKLKGIRYTPIKRVGICVPGASAPLPSTVIMTAVPAQVAGVKEIVVISPPRYNGSIHPVILAVCYELGISEVYRIGGAQAVAALAYGTPYTKEVDKIVGPGSIWVQLAKKEVMGFVGIDSVAGPSEVLIIANKQANPAWVAADMLSQAEHNPGSAILFTDSEKLAIEVLAQLNRQTEELSRSRGTIDCLLEFGAIVVFRQMPEILNWANLFAAEHLEIQCGKQSRQIANKIQNAGAIFTGDYSPVAVGDYWAGPSHTLPTGMSAKFSGALTSNDFVKSISIIEYDKKKLAASADDIIRLAEAEGLDAHARSIRIRQENRS